MKQKEDPAPKVDRLTLHQSSPSPTFSNSSHSDLRDDLLLKSNDLGTSFGLKRPETSRGRQGRGQDAELSNQGKESPSEEGQEKDEGRVKKEKDEGIKREKNMDDSEVEEERETLMKDKEKRFREIQDELTRQEEEEERKLKSESEDRLR